MDADFVFEVEELLFEHKQLCSYYERHEPSANALTVRLRQQIDAATDALYEGDGDALGAALTDIGHALEAIKKMTYGK